MHRGSQRYFTAFRYYRAMHFNPASVRLNLLRSYMYTEMILYASIMIPQCCQYMFHDVIQIISVGTSTHIYLLTPKCRALLEKLTGLQLVKKFLAFHGTRRFITALTSVRHLSLSWASPIQSIYVHPTSWRSILILPTHLCLGLPSDLLPSGFPTKTLYTSLSSLIRATCPAHFILLDFITRTILGEVYKFYACILTHIQQKVDNLQFSLTKSLLKRDQIYCTWERGAVRTHGVAVAPLIQSIDRSCEEWVWWCSDEHHCPTHNYSRTIIFVYFYYDISMAC